MRDDIVEFIADHQTLFSPILIDPEGMETMDDHLLNMKKPMVWATQVEIQAAVELYALPLYLYTQTPDKRSYHWLHYTQWMHSATCIKHNHIELAHPGSTHFDCIIDAATLQQAKIHLS